MNSRSAFYLGIDQGTQSSRAIVFDQHGDIVSRAHVKVGIQTLPNQFVEQDGNEILQSIETCLASVFREIKPEAVHSAGLATQRSSVIAWDKQTGEVFCKLISWRDRRAADFVATLHSHEAEIEAKSGLKLTPYYGASKLRWLLQNNQKIQLALKNDRLHLGPLATYLINRICQSQPYLVDHANALRMQLLNRSSLTWDSELCDWFEVPAKQLPEPVDTNYHYGNLRHTDIPLNAVNGDQTAAMYSQGNIQPGEVLVNLGTGGFVLSPVDQEAEIPDGLLGGLSMSHGHDVTRLIEGTINGCGSALNWFKKTVKYAGQFDLDHCINSSRGELLFMNGINGLGSPIWKDIDNQFIHTESLVQVENPALDQAVAAIIESILFLVRLNITRMNSVVVVRSIRLSGGLSNSQCLCQHLADLCGLEVSRPDITEATARGVAWLAGSRTHGWPTGAATMTFSPRREIKLEDRYQSFIRVLYRQTGFSPG